MCMYVYIYIYTHTHMQVNGMRGDSQDLLMAPPLRRFVYYTCCP